MASYTPPAELARGCCFDLQLRDPRGIQELGGTVTGALQFRRSTGAVFDGTNDYITFSGPGLPIPFNTGFLSFVWVFYPAFAAAEAVDRVLFYLSDTTGVVQKDSGGTLACNVGGVGVSSLLAAYEPYWRVNQRNVLVGAFRSGAQTLWLNGVQIGTAAGGASGISTAYTSMAIGARTTGIRKFLGSIASVKFFRHNNAAELLTSQEASDFYLNRTFNYAKRAVVSLPMQMSQHEPNHALQVSEVDQTQLCADADMEAAGVAAWTTFGAGGTFQKVAGSRPGGTGTRVLQIIRAGAMAYCYQTILTVGTRYRVTGWARGDGLASWPRVGTGAATYWSGTTSASWQYCDCTFVATNANFTLYNHTDDGTCEFDDFAVRQSANILSDPDVEASNLDAWSVGNLATLTKSSTLPYQGTYCLQVAFNAVASPYAAQFILTVGKRYRVTGYARGDGVRAPLVQDGAVVLWTGTAVNTWQAFSADFTATTTAIRFYSNAVAAGYCEFDALSVVEFRSRTLDASGHGNNLTLGDGTTATTQPTKLSQRGYSLDGGDYFKRETAIGIPADFTVAMLVRPTSSTGTRALWSCRNSAGAKSLAVYGTAAAEILTILHNVGASTILTTVPLPLGVASHYCFAYINSTRVLQIYYNGALAYTSAALTDTNGHDNGFWLGALSTPEYYWTGSILQADVMAFAATPLQVRDHYHQSISQVGAV